MTLSVVDIFKVGIGPSSSHTVGPMNAAASFLKQIDENPSVVTLSCHLYGSLALTGLGHATDKAVTLGLLGELPDRIDPLAVGTALQRIQREGIILRAGRKLRYSPEQNLHFHRAEELPEHPNGLMFQGLDEQGTVCLEQIYYSVGGGFVVPAGQRVVETTYEVPYPFTSGDALLALCEETGLNIADLVRRNEKAMDAQRQRHAQASGVACTTAAEHVQMIWGVMQDCVHNGIVSTGILPGGLQVKRRAPDLHAQLTRPSVVDEQGSHQKPGDDLASLDWVNLYAIAVNEENAAGGRVVTAPTNGAAGVIPAVLHYGRAYLPHLTTQHLEDFLFVATAIAILFKENASLSGAEVGCQGEVGVAASMAAAGLAAVMGGTPTQIENAAEIAMEHHLGLTCDPVGGLVQVPCIERNAMGAVKAINAARMALRGDGSHVVSLDKVIKTMKKTGDDMMSKYKETSRGGLAIFVNLPEC
jgi:L-serine dehydratase